MEVKPVKDDEDPTAFIIGNPNQDFDLLARRNYETLLDYDENETESYHLAQRRREEEEISKFNFETFLERQKEEQDYGSENDNHDYGSDDSTQEKEKECKEEKTTA